MRRLAISLTIGAFAVLSLVATVAAASPAPTPLRGPAQAGGTIPTVLGLSRAQVMDLRHDGLTLIQIADREKVDPQKLIDALVAQWSGRIDARVANGAITAAEAATLKSQLIVEARAMVNQVAPGGMGGAALGAGPGAGGQAGGGRGTGMGGRANGAAAGPCDGTGHGGSTTP